MAKVKTVRQYDSRIRQLQKELELMQRGRDEAVERAKGMIGDVFLSACPNVPFERAECKVYAEAVSRLISAHQDEFDALMQGGGSDDQADAAQQEDDDSDLDDTMNVSSDDDFSDV